MCGVHENGRRDSEMRSMKRRVGYGYVVGRAGVVLAGVYVLLTPVFAQDAQEPDWSRIAGNFGEVKVLPNGGLVPRTADGHPDLTGRYYPNRAGRMIQFGYQLSDDVLMQYDRTVTPWGEIPFRPGTREKYRSSRTYGTCDVGGTPSSITVQDGQHGPMDLVQKPGVLWILTEYPLTTRWLPTDGRPHSEDPDVSFNGESVGHWEGETLVVDTIAIDERMRNISVGRRGDGGAWTHSPEERVIERFTRTSENYLTYQVTVIDPVVLEAPFVSVPPTWTLAQAPDDVWTEYLCTTNEERFYVENMDPETKKLHESRQLSE